MLNISEVLFVFLILDKNISKVLELDLFYYHLKPGKCNYLSGYNLVFQPPKSQFEIDFILSLD